MMRITRCQLGLAVALSALALGVQAQQPAGTAPSAAAPAAHSAKAPPAHAKKPHAATAQHKTRHTSTKTHRQAMAGAESSAPDSAYKAALRRCVTGPESARDSCIDAAIAQYGRA